MNDLRQLDIDTLLKIFTWLIGGAFTLTITGVPLLHKLGFWNWLWKKCTPSRQAIGELKESVETARAEMKKAVEVITTNQRKIDDQFSPNGGSTLRDGMDRIERTVAYLQSKSRNVDDADEAPLFELDANGNLIYANCAFCTLVNADEKEIEHWDWLGHILSSQRDRVLRELTMAIEKRLPVDIEADWRVGPLKTQAIVLSIQPRVVGSGNTSELRGFFGRARPVG